MSEPEKKNIIADLLAPKKEVSRINSHINLFGLFIDKIAYEVIVLSTNIHIDKIKNK